jgi:hypothetical protein
MGAVAWTSSMALADHYQSERERWRADLAASPTKGRQALRRIYAAKASPGSCSTGSSKRSVRTTGPPSRRS